MTSSGRRRHTAMSSASSSNSVRRWFAIAQPTIRRLNASSTTARNRNPAHVGMYVTSATHKRSGAAASNFRSTRSGAGRASRSRRVVQQPFRRLAPTSPAWRISRETRLRPTAVPSSLSSACTRGMPYVPRDFWWIPRMRSSSAASESARAEGERFFHA